MDRNDNLSEKLLQENGPTTEEEFARLIGDIQKMLRKEKSRRWQMIGVTAALWLGVLVSLVLKLPSSPSMIANSGNSLNAFRLYLSIFVEFLPAGAALSSIILLIRWRSFSIREINLRMQMFELRLLKQEKGERGKS